MLDWTSTPSSAQKQGEAASSLSLGACPATPEQCIVSDAFASYAITQLLTYSTEHSVETQLPKHVPVFSLDGDLMEGALVLALDG